ncbi:MAG: PQQ-binding-like beta-propeller repeat protein, partial [Phycisphaerae bacterium]|nr:PQQ-binding-like beta-propeller repeat protein [Phycisphaerae bacterium]
STLAEEIETLFALSEAYERKGDMNAAARCLRTIIETYGRHEYPISPLAALDGGQVLGAANQTLDRTTGFLGDNLYSKEMSRSLTLMRRGLPLYLSTVSPLPKTLTLRAGERAAWQLARLQKTSSQFAGDFEKTATTELDGKTEPEQLQRMWEFPGTTAAQKTLEALCESSGKLDPVLARQRLWRLSDAARVGNLKLPEKFAAKLTTPDFDKLTVTIPQTAKPYDFADADGASRLILQRGDDQSQHGELMFVGGRVRKRVDNKFILTCMDLKTGTKKWETIDIRLKGSGQEAGFYEAFVLGDRVIVHGLYDVLAFNVADGKAIWSYRVPFDFEIKNALLSGDLLMLAGKTETLALYLPTENPNGEVAWQVGEMGDLYIMPYMRNDRLISVRKLPYSVTVRYRSTGQLIGRLDLPDLSMHMAHPLIEGGPEELPAAHCDNLLAVTDGWYYVVVDTDKLAISWKRLIDSNDVTREPAMRLALSTDYLCVLKEDYDQKAIYMLSARTGEVLWNSNPKDPNAPVAMHSLIIAGETVYGIIPHAGQGFYMAAVECKSGKRLYKQEYKDYQSKPKIGMLPQVYGGYLVLQLEDRQDFEVKAFEAKTGKLAHDVKDKGVAPFGVHGRLSATVQAGRVVLLGKDKMQE